jgi:hypothetical protein
MSRREKSKPSKAEREARRLRRDAQELDKIVRDTAAVFRSSFETGRDCAAECHNRRDDLCADLNYRRLPYEIWRARPGAEELVSIMADVIAENERHLAAIERLCLRVDDLTDNGTWHETLSTDMVPDELIRRRLFSDPPA